jgi:hypothetical protein
VHSQHARAGVDRDPDQHGEVPVASGQDGLKTQSATGLVEVLSEAPASSAVRDCIRSAGPLVSDDARPAQLPALDLILDPGQHPARKVPPAQQVPLRLDDGTR